MSRPAFGGFRGRGGRDGSFRGGRGGFRGGRDGSSFRGGKEGGGGGGGFRGGRDRDGGGFRGGRGGFRGGRGGFRGGRDGERGSFRGRGRGGPRGGRGGGRGGMRGGKKVVIEPHRHDGVFIAHGKEDSLCTVNFDKGESVYGEKRVTVDDGEPIEYRMWNPFRSKLAAAILSGVENIYMSPGTKVLYLGAASGTTVSHVSDLVGSTGVVFAVEFSHRSGRDLLQVAQRRNNIVPIIEDARHPLKYRMLIPCLVDTVFADVAQPDQARILALNASYYLKAHGHFVMSIKANCIDSTAKAEHVFASEIEKLKKGKLKPEEQVSLEPYERDHCVVIGSYRSE